MSIPTLPPDCPNPHHADMARRAVNGEIAAWHLKGWAMITDALCELRRISSYDHQSEDGVTMLMGDAFRRMAETLEAPVPPTPPKRGRARKPLDDNVRWLDARLKELEEPKHGA